MTAIRKCRTSMVALAVGIAGSSVMPAPLLAQSSTGGSRQVPVSRVRLEVAPGPCSLISPQGNPLANPNFSDVNDGDFDDVEVEAVQQGCTFCAFVTDRNGRGLRGVTVNLQRRQALGIRAFCSLDAPIETRKCSQAQLLPLQHPS